jgi:DNA-binding NtrC family response regulator
MKILVVDDERDAKLLFERRFRREITLGEMEFVFALSGESALEILDSTGRAGVTLLLADISLPGLSGLDLLKTCKARHTEVKVMMITAYGSVAIRDKALRDGADGFFTKPLDFISLKQKIRSIKQP